MKDLRLILTRGLPASGKSRWAIDQVAQSNGCIVRLNKDTLREMLHASKHSKERERQVIALRDLATNQLLADGLSVIWDDTNLNPVHGQVATAIAAAYGARLVWQDFTDVVLEVCLRRDAQRFPSVGPQVIRRMHRQYLAPAPEVYVPPAGGICADIVDLDGTLALMAPGGRGPYDWSRVGEDLPSAKVIELVRQRSKAGQGVIIVSGRDEVCMEETLAWLATHDVYWDWLFMRPAGDTRKDAVVKMEIFETSIRDDFAIDLVFDDRDQTVAMWRSLGLTCLQVAEGSF